MLKMSFRSHGGSCWDRDDAGIPMASGQLATMNVVLNRPFRAGRLTRASQQANLVVAVYLVFGPRLKHGEGL